MPLGVDRLTVATVAGHVPGGNVSADPAPAEVAEEGWSQALGASYRDSRRERGRPGRRFGSSSWFPCAHKQLVSAPFTAEASSSQPSEPERGSVEPRQGSLAHSSGGAARWTLRPHSGHMMPSPSGIGSQEPGQSSGARAMPHGIAAGDAGEFAGPDLARPATVESLLNPRDLQDAPRPARKGPCGDGRSQGSRRPKMLVCVLQYATGGSMSL